jgi:hypothetical protein
MCKSKGNRILAFCFALRVFGGLISLVTPGTAVMPGSRFSWSFFAPTPLGLVSHAFGERVKNVPQKAKERKSRRIRDSLRDCQGAGLALSSVHGFKVCDQFCFLFSQKPHATTMIPARLHLNSQTLM